MSNINAEMHAMTINSEQSSIAAGTIGQPGEGDAQEHTIVELGPDEYVELPSVPPPLLPSRRRTVPVIHA